MCALAAVCADQRVIIAGFAASGDGGFRHCACERVSHRICSPTRAVAWA
jgi:hypothetical protein